MNWIPLAALTAASLGWSEVSAEAILATVASRYEQLSTTAYRVRVKTERKLQNAIGPGVVGVNEVHQIEFAPGRDRYTYEFVTHGVRVVIVSNGERTWRYRSPLNSFTESANSSEEARQAKEVVLIAERRLVGRFADLGKLEIEAKSKGVRQVKRGRQTTTCWVVEIIPQPEGKQVWTEQLCIDPATFDVVTSTFREQRQGLVAPESEEFKRTFELFETGVEFPEEHFQFSPPPRAKRKD